MSNNNAQENFNNHSSKIGENVVMKKLSPMHASFGLDANAVGRFIEDGQI